ncbi:recombinase family protein [Phyllobacterium sp. LjRoot231]
MEARTLRWLDRLARSVSDLVTITETLKRKGMGLQSGR